MACHEFVEIHGHCITYALWIQAILISTPCSNQESQRNAVWVKLHKGIIHTSKKCMVCSDIVARKSQTSEMDIIYAEKQNSKKEMCLFWSPCKFNFFLKLSDILLLVLKAGSGLRIFWGSIFARYYSYCPGNDLLPFPTGRRVFSGAVLNRSAGLAWGFDLGAQMTPKRTPTAIEPCYWLLWRVRSWVISQSHHSDRYQLDRQRTWTALESILG